MMAEFPRKIPELNLLHPVFHQVINQKQVMSRGRHGGRSEAVGVGDRSAQGLSLPLNLLEVQSKL